MKVLEKFPKWRVRLWELRYRALDRRVQALVPGSILARRPKRQSKRHKNGHSKAIAVAQERRGDHEGPGHQKWCARIEERR